MMLTDYSRCSYLGFAQGSRSYSEIYIGFQSYLRGLRSLKKESQTSVDKPQCIKYTLHLHDQIPFEYHLNAK